MAEPEPANQYQKLVVEMLKNLGFEYLDEPFPNLPAGCLRYRPTAKTIEMITRAYRDGKGQGVFVTTAGGLMCD